MLLPLLAAEGATLLNIRGLLNVHAFIGMLLVPVVAVKLVSTGWRMARYYTGGEEYVRRGPPTLLIRMLVAPAVVASTLVLFGTGVALLLVDQTQGMLVGLHKASFVVWFGALSVHVLTRLPALVRALRHRLPGGAFRVGLATLSVVAGLGLAMTTLPQVDHLQDNVSTQIGLDGG